MANKLGSKILDFLRFDNEEEFDDDFYEDDIDEFSERELQREARREEKERKKNCLSIFVLSQRRMRCFAC